MKNKHENKENRIISPTFREMNSEQSTNEEQEGPEERGFGFNLLMLLLFAASGAAGLIYEVVWIRQFTNVLGASTHALTIVLAAFMMGLGLGAWALGKLSDRLSEANIAKGYILVEVGMGLYALVLPLLLALAEKFYVWFYGIVEPGLLASNCLRFVIAFCLLAAPTTLMGATLPLMSRYFIRMKSQISLSISRLYSANTFGAIAGAAMTGFVLLPRFGILASTRLAVGVNFMVAFGFWLAHSAMNKGSGARMPAMPTTSAIQSLSVKITAKPCPPRVQSAAMLAYCLSGAAAMLYEVSWTRTLSMILGTTTYAFSTMVATFLLGIALGSALYGLIPKDWSRSRVFTWLQLLTALAVLCTIPLFEKLPVFYLRLHSLWAFTWLNVQFVRFVLAASIMLIPTIAMGALFPVMGALLIDETDQVGQGLGKAYGMNTIGAVSGTIVGGLILVPLVGMQKTILIGAAMNVSAGLVVLLSLADLSLRRRMVFAAGLSCTALVAIALIEPWAPRVINSGVYVYASRYNAMEERYQAAAENREDVPELPSSTVWEMAMKQYDLLYYNPGIAATVAVMERSDGVRFLTIDGKTDASTGERSDMRTQVMIGQLPFLLHPNPDKALVVGLGSGVTAGSALTHNVRVVDCAEISPGVIEASQFFNHVNHDALNDRRLRIVPRDARNLLLTTDDSYDIIISQPSNPWIKGESSLFTLEWYRLVHEHLADSGLFVQWVPAYLMADRDIKVVAHTLRSVFPNLTVWTSGSVGDLVFLGSKGGALKIDYQRFLKRINERGVYDDLARVGIDPANALFDSFLMSPETLSSYLYADLREPIRNNTDDHLITEFSTPRRLNDSAPASYFAHSSNLKGDAESLMEMLTNIDEDEFLRLAGKADDGDKSWDSPRGKGARTIEL